jgi:Putative Ig domain
VSPVKLNRFFWSPTLCLLLTACGDNGSGLPAVNAPAPGAPQISGQPASQVVVGQQWYFQPKITDPDGDRVTVTASNLPGWINLDTNTGLMRGTPGNADMQTWSGIQLRVTDGVNTTSLPSFAVTVLDQNAGIGNVTLSWLAPTETTDGAPVNLSGYRLLYGQISRNYSYSIEIDNPGITRYMIDGLTSGTWYFAIQAIGIDGIPSEPSAEGQKTI